MSSSYKHLLNFGKNSENRNGVNNPLSYCINDTMDQRFLHGSQSDTYGQHSKPCQLFMSEYCSKKWDSFCEVASQNTNDWVPNNVQSCLGSSDVACKGLNAGEILIRNTASRKYLVDMLNAKKKYEPFDPTVPSSPMISYFVPTNGCASYGSNRLTPIYSVDPKTIDSDIVMNKILRKPLIAFDILINIYNTMKRNRTLRELSGTRLGLLYSRHPYFVSRGGLH